MDTPTNDRFLRFSIATTAIVKKIQKYENDRLGAYGMRSMHLMFMYCLSQKNGGMTPSELAKACSVDKAFISRISGDLISLGYIECEELSDALSRKRIHLTPAGSAVMNEINIIIRETVSRIIKDLSENELRTFYLVIAKLDENLN